MSSNVFFDKINNRLVMMGNKADDCFWDTHWDKEDFRNMVLTASADPLVLKNTKKYLKPRREIKILEGGCGDGHFVYALDKAGYDAYGVDFAQETVAKINENFPYLKVYVEDLRKMSFPDLNFDAYWSLGVIEHFFDGYDNILSEMNRVIKIGGYLFLTFPVMSLLRKLKSKLGFYKNFDKNNFDREKFYQFALDGSRVESKFAEKGFVLVHKSYKNGSRGLLGELGIKKAVYSIKISIIRRIIIKLAKLTSFFTGHAVLLIFKKV